LRRNGGTELSTVAAQSTWVLPHLISAEPSAVLRKPGIISMDRSWSGLRPSLRIAHHQNHHHDDENHSAHENDETGYAGLNLREGVLGFLFGFVFAHRDRFFTGVSNQDLMLGPPNGVWFAE
jgi:hypothetical protein